MQDPVLEREKAWHGSQRTGPICDNAAKTAAELREVRRGRKTTKEETEAAQNDTERDGDRSEEQREKKRVRSETEKPEAGVLVRKLSQLT